MNKIFVNEPLYYTKINSINSLDKNSIIIKDHLDKVITHTYVLSIVSLISLHGFIYICNKIK